MFEFITVIKMYKCNNMTHCFDFFNSEEIEHLQLLLS